MDGSLLFQILAVTAHFLAGICMHSKPFRC